MGTELEVGFHCRSGLYRTSGVVVCCQPSLEVLGLYETTLFYPEAPEEFPKDCQG
jgi:hypothetical protein